MPENVPIVFPSNGGIDVLFSYPGWASGLPWLIEYGGNDAMGPPRLSGHKKPDHYLLGF